MSPPGFLIDSRPSIMKRFCVFVAFALFLCTANSQTNLSVTYSFANFSSHPTAVTGSYLTPLKALANYNGSMLTGSRMYPDWITTTNCGWTNLTPGYTYVFTLMNPLGNDTFTNGFPAGLSGSVNAWQYRGVWVGQMFAYLLPPGFSPGPVGSSVWESDPTGWLFSPTNAFLGISNQLVLTNTVFTNATVSLVDSALDVDVQSGIYFGGAHPVTLFLGVSTNLQFQIGSPSHPATVGPTPEGTNGNGFRGDFVGDLIGKFTGNAGGATNIQDHPLPFPTWTGLLVTGDSLSQAGNIGGSNLWAFVFGALGGTTPAYTNNTAVGGQTSYTNLQLYASNTQPYVSSMGTNGWVSEWCELNDIQQSTNWLFTFQNVSNRCFLDHSNGLYVMLFDCPASLASSTGPQQTNRDMLNLALANATNMWDKFVPVSRIFPTPSVAPSRYLPDGAHFTPASQCFLGACVMQICMRPDHVVYYNFSQNPIAEFFITGDSTLGNVLIGAANATPFPTGIQNTIAGQFAGFAAMGGSNNAAYGYNSLHSDTTGFDNSGFGFSTLRLNVGGQQNSAFGYSVLGANTSGSVNSAFGTQSMSGNQTGANNSAFGGLTLQLNVSGTDNSAFGESALQNSTGVNNSAFGFGAGNATVGNSGIFIGFDAGAYETGGNSFYLSSFNWTNTAAEKVHALLYGTQNTTALSQTLTVNATLTALGLITGNGGGLTNLVIYSDALDNVQMGVTANAVPQPSFTGTANTSIGRFALHSLTTGSNNISLSYNSLFYNLTGNDNVVLGWSAGLSNLVGNQNILLGSFSGHGNTNGVGNISIGELTMANGTTGSGNIAIGSQSLLNTSGNHNVGVGRLTLSTTTAGNSVAVGDQAGMTLAGNSSVYLGFAAGKYATASGEFYVGNADYSNTAGDKSHAMLYGLFNATTANQTLNVNAVLNTPYTAGFDSQTITNGLTATTVTTSNIGVSNLLTATTETVGTLTGTNVATFNGGLLFAGGTNTGTYNQTNGLGAGLRILPAGTTTAFEVRSNSTATAALSLNTNGQFTIIAGDATTGTGPGVAIMVGFAKVVGQTNTLSSTTVYTCPAGVTNSYEITAGLVCTTGGSAGTVSVTAVWQDADSGGADSIQPFSSTLALTSAPNSQALTTQLINPAPGSAIKYKTTVTGNVGGAGAYKLVFCVKRVQ